MARWKTIFSPLLLLSGLLLLAGCPQTVPNPQPMGPNEPMEPSEPTNSTASFDGVPEIEPNDALGTPMVVTYDANGEARIAAEIARAEKVIDIDFFALGTVRAGDRIIIDVDTPDSELDPVMAVTDADGLLFYYDNDGDVTAGDVDPSMDEIVRETEVDYFLAVAPARKTLLPGGTYQLTIRIERGGPPPLPQRQTLFLDFNGGRIALPDGKEISVGPLNAISIDPLYAGRTPRVKDAIAATVRQNFARFDVEILTTDTDQPPTDRPFSTILFGGSDPGGFGIAPQGIDVYNKNPSDDAIVFTQSFVPSRFTSPPSPEQLGVAIGNVAAHEAGHLLGLQHASNSRDLMNPFDAPDTLLGDQRFRESFLGQALSLVFFFLPTDQAIIEQDGARLLENTVGRTPKTPTLDFVLGEGPSDIVITDLNNDGLEDIAVPNTFTDDVIILLNDGDGTYTQTPSPTVLSGPFPIAAGDLNGDGHTDLAVASLAGGEVVPLINDGAGTFTPLGAFLVLGFPVDVALGDVDDDGDLDAIVADFIPERITETFDSGNLVIQLNDGTGMLETAAILAPGTLPQEVVAVDVDEDGDVDLVAARLATLQDIDDNGGVMLIVNNGDGTFADPVALIAGDVPVDIVPDDVNGDGRVDLITANQFSEDVTVLLGNGDATFADATHWVAGDGTFAVTTADFDGDGDVDIAAANPDSDHVSLLFNAGNGTFAPEIFIGVNDSPDAIASGDVDGDGDIDIVLTHIDLNTISILFNNGDGTFGSTATAANRLGPARPLPPSLSKSLQDIGRRKPSYCLTCQTARRQR